MNTSLSLTSADLVSEPRPNVLARPPPVRASRIHVPVPGVTAPPGTEKIERRGSFTSFVNQVGQTITGGFSPGSTT
jgi:hypothetical protein